MRKIAWLVLILSVIPLGLMTTESYISKQFAKTEATNVLAPTVTWQGQTFSFQEQLSDDVYYDNFTNKIQLATLQLQHNGQTFEELTLPANIDSETSDRYYGLLAFIAAEDTFSVVINKTPNEPFEEKTIAQVITFTKNGEQQERFIDKNRSFEDKYLLQLSSISYEGYITNLNQRWPSIFFPILYPFGTLVLSLILLIFIYTKRRIA